MKKIILLLTIFITCPLLLSGCWDYTEYEDMAQVSVLGLDYNKETEEITITVQYTPTTKGGKSSSSEGSGSAPNTKGVIHSATDKTVYGGLAKLQEVISKRLFYGYLKIIVFGEDAAKYKLLDLIELHDRSPLIRPSAYFFITSGQAKNVVSTVDAAKIATSSQEIYSLINLSPNTGAAYPVTIQDFIEMLAIGGLEATAPRVVYTDKSSQNPEAKGGTQDDIKFDEEVEGDVRVAGVAAFKGDKFIGWLGDKESLGYGWITGKNITAYKTSETSDGTSTENIIYYRLDKSKGKIKVQIENGSPVFQVDVKAVAQLRKYYSSKGSGFLSPEEVSAAENKLSESIRSDIEAALIKAQKEMKSDIFGFGFALFRKNPKLWQTKYQKDWEDIFPTLPISVNVDSKISNTGTNIKKLEVK